MTSLEQQPLGELARDIPGATAVFHRYKLDFCCGGRQSLAEAAGRKQLDHGAIVAELNELQARGETTETAAQLSDGELIDHILNRYHARHREQLPELIRLAARVERVHGARPLCPLGLATHLETMLSELEAHMAKEEQVLFPLIKRGVGAMASAPVQVMRAEHDDHSQALDRLHELTQGLTLPEDACNTWLALYTGLAVLQTDLMDHIHLENNVLFARIDGG